MRRILCGLLLAVLICGAGPSSVQADLPNFELGIWSINSGGIWRKEVRTRELARWYRHYEWISDQRLWLKRRAEGVWVNGESINQFTCRSHCVIRNPNGPGVWRIWRLFRRTDVRRFRAHYRVFWAGINNPALGDSLPNAADPNPLNARFTLALDHLEVVTEMEPQDPDPSTPNINENVEIMDENGVLHFLGEPGFQVLPDTQMNPGGYQLISTAQSELLLPPPADRLIDPPFAPQPGMAEIADGVVVEWLVDQNGNVLVDVDGVPGPDPLLSPQVLGDQKHQGLIAQPTGVDGNELDLDQGNSQLQLYCWLLDPSGEVLGNTPGVAVIGPPVDMDGDGAADNAFGAPIPMDPTVRDEFDQRDPTVQPARFTIIEEDEPTPAELNDLNNLLAQQGIAPVFPPFKLCIRSLRARSIWGIDRRVVMDTWFHHWRWRIQHHFTVSGGGNRIWLSRAALTSFTSEHHHYPAGGVPTWNTFSITQLRFFRVCYRIHCPRPGLARAKIDQIWATVPIDPNNPAAGLMLITTESNENALPPPDVRAGLVPDVLPGGQTFPANGVIIDPIDPILETLDIGGGGTSIFDGDIPAAPGMTSMALVGNEDFEEALLNNQLQLYCWILNADGTLQRESFNIGTGQPLVLTSGPTPAIPTFQDDMGNTTTDATKLDLDIDLVPTSTDIKLPTVVSLRNYPNPFSGLTSLMYKVPAVVGVEKPYVSLAVHDMRGRRVAALVSQPMTPGEYTAQWDASTIRNLASGVYFARLQVGAQQTTQKLVLTR